MRSRHLLPALALALLAGCQTMDMSGLRKMSDKLAITGKDEKGKHGEHQTPARVVAIWSDAMYTQPGLPPTRGFGGRLYFYNTKDKPVPVEGQLVVYAYDDSLDGTPAKTPSRKFAFTPEQLSKHYSATELGDSYSVWIPWDQVGGIRKSISLLPVFTSSSGQVVMGEQSINVLPGKTPEPTAPAPPGNYSPLSSQGPYAVQPAAYAGASPNAAPPRDSWQQIHTYEPSANSQPPLRSTTIQLPMSMTKRLMEQTSVTPTTQLAPVQTQESMGSTTPRGAQGGAEYTTAPGAAAPPATRFVRSRSQVLRAPAARSSPIRAATPPRPAGPQPFPPFPPAPPPGPSAEGSAPADFAPAGWDR